MNSRSKYIALAAGAILSLCLVGCGGINARGTVSPATFFMPGLMKAEPQPVPQDPLEADPVQVQQVAQAR